MRGLMAVFGQDLWGVLAIFSTPEAKEDAEAIIGSVNHY